ncbi:glutamate transporter permease GluD [Mycobacteroides abscessus subsp. abscessus]|nr:glutamate transporter permease GluD [Mycobacteroides abscessus subsp. abscessus]
MRSGQQLGASESNTIPALIVVAVVMIALNSTLTVVATRLERRLRAGRRAKGGGAVLAADSIITDAAPGMDLEKK